MAKKKEFPIIIFADGASSGNPGPGGWGAIIATPDGQVIELGGFQPKTTNNQMELMAVVSALSRAAKIKGEVWVYTDSTYVIRGITQWVWGWRKKGWVTAEGKPVSNEAIWKQLIAVVAARGKDQPIEWKFVKGHAGVAGNERVDEIAVAFSKRKRPELYHGPLMKYSIAVHDLPPDVPLPEMKPKLEKVAAHSYLSLIGGVARRHNTWAECERWVKGQSGAKFKKTTNAADEARVLDDWGIKPSQVRDGDK